MIIALKTIMDFHHKRTQAHIDCLNYFAGLLGYHFPEHDNDKNSGQMRTGYAYINYANYHPDFKISNARTELYHEMHAEHHRMQSHHIEHYTSASDITDITLIEMVCDWHSANFEQNHVIHNPSSTSVRDFFDTIMQHKMNWSEKQIALIYEVIDFLSIYANYDDIMAIWRPLLSL